MFKDTAKNDLAQAFILYVSQMLGDMKPDELKRLGLDVMLEQADGLLKQENGKCCPRCRSQNVRQEGSGFVEQGRFDGQNYENDGQADQYVCGACGYGFLEWVPWFPTKEVPAGAHEKSFDVDISALASVSTRICVRARDNAEASQKALAAAVEHSGDLEWKYGGLFNDDFDVSGVSPA